MQIFIEGNAKEIADLAFLLQCQRELKRKPYSDDLELNPAIRDSVSSSDDQSE